MDKDVGMLFYFLREAAVNEVFYWRLRLHFCSFLDLFLDGSSLSVDKHWQYHQRYHELLGRKSAAFIWFIYHKHIWIWMVQSGLLKYAGIILKKIESFWNFS